MPVVTEIIERNANRSLDRIPWVDFDSNILSLASDIISLFSDLIELCINEERKEAKAQLVQMAVYNYGQLFKEVAIPEWESLDIEQPGGNQRQQIEREGEEDVENDPDMIEEDRDSEEEDRREDTDEDIEEIETTEYADYDEYDVEEVPPLTMPILEDITGSAYLEVYDQRAARDLAMNIQKSEGLVMSVRDFSDGDRMADIILSPKKNRSAPKKQTTVYQFETTKAYGAGTEFRIKAQGDAMIYVFAIHSTGKMYSLYPNQGGVDDIPAGTFYEVPDEYSRGNDEFVKVPKNQYMLIQDNPGAAPPPVETMIVLFSRSELDVKDIFKQMEAMGTDMSPREKLADIFGTLAATPEQSNLSISKGIISYQLDEGGPVVVPVVFGIKRK